MGMYTPCGLSPRKLSRSGGGLSPSRSSDLQQLSIGILSIIITAYSSGSVRDFHPVPWPNFNLNRPAV